MNRALAVDQTPIPDSPLTPELDKMARIRDESFAVGEFIDWLQQQHIILATYRDDLTDVRPCMPCQLFHDHPLENCENCGGDGTITITLAEHLVPMRVDPEQMLADFFEIDLNRVEDERRAILATYRQD